MGAGTRREQRVGGVRPGGQGGAGRFRNRSRHEQRLPPLTTTPTQMAYAAPATGGPSDRTRFALGPTAGALAAPWVESFGLCRVAIAVMAWWGICLVPFGFGDSSLVVVHRPSCRRGRVRALPPLQQTVVQRYTLPGSITAVAAATGTLIVPAAPTGTPVGGLLLATIGPGATLLASGLATILAAAVGAMFLLAHTKWGAAIHTLSRLSPVLSETPSWRLSRLRMSPPMFNRTRAVRRAAPRHRR